MGRRLAYSRAQGKEAKLDDGHSVDLRLLDREISLVGDRLLCVGDWNLRALDMAEAKRWIEVLQQWQEYFILNNYQMSVLQDTV